MTIQEAKDILVLRLDFRVDSAAPVSGRYFESENHIITLDMIKEVQANSNISDIQFLEYLDTMKEECVVQVLSRIFDKDEINEDLINCYPSLYDDLISLSMAVKVFNLILTTTRSNRSERIGKDALQLMLLELNGNRDNPHLPFSKGMIGRFEDELRRVKNKLFKQRKFASITMGAVKRFL